MSAEIDVQGLKQLANWTSPHGSTENPLETEQEKREEKNHSARILKSLLNFNVYGFKATNCIFKKDIIEIYYLLEDSGSITKKELNKEELNKEEFNKEGLKQELASRLGIEVERLKLMKLRSPPVFKETSINPGDRVHRNGDPQSQCSVGAFVNVEGKGIHALLSGHGKNPGDHFVHQDGDLLEVVLSLTSPPPPPIASNDDLFYRDIALALIKRKEQASEEHNSFISSGNHTIYLNAKPEEAADDMAIHLFASGDRIGTIHSTNYHRLDHRLQIIYRLISVLDQQRHPVHDDGESGMIIATNPVENKVTAVGMLIALETLEVDESPPITYSLAAPLTTGFEALIKDPYCGGQVIFC